MSNWEAREAKRNNAKKRMPKHGKTSLRVISGLDRTPRAVVDLAVGEGNLSGGKRGKRKAGRVCPQCGGPKNKKAAFCKNCTAGIGTESL